MPRFLRALVCALDLACWTFGNLIEKEHFPRHLEICQFYNRESSEIVLSECLKMTGVPVAPLRDALRVLEADGIVTIHPRAGIDFIKPELELTRATYQFRGIIESSAVAIYAETADDAEMLAIEMRHLRSVESVETEGLTPVTRTELEALEDELHNAIIASLRNPLIDTSYRRIHNYLRIFRLDRRITVPLALCSLHEHLAIIQACRHSNAVETQAALQTHFSNAMQRNMGQY